MNNREVMVGRYTGRVAVVTGCASGIGAAISRRLMAEGAGVVGADINDERLAKLSDELGQNFTGIRADVTNEYDIEKLVASAVSTFGRLDAGFNVAGVGRSARLLDQSLDGWNSVLGVCLTGVMLAMKYEGRQLVGQGGGGAIVNVASLNAVMPMFDGAAYCTAKAGVAMLSQCGALELGEHGIRVNTLSPGITDTPLTAPSLTIDGVREAYLDRVPLKTVGSPESMASAALYLGAPEAEYVSGVNLVVDGGWATTGYPDLRRFMSGVQT